MTDEEIALLVQEDDVESFGILVDRYEIKLMRYAKRFLPTKEDIEDIVQEVFIKAYTNIHGFNAKRRFSPWIYRIAHNEFVNALKKKSNEPLPFFDPDTIFPHPVADVDLEKELDFKELKNDLDKLLYGLNPKYREPLILYFFEEMSYLNIAEVLHIPVSTVGVRIKRGKNILKELYKKIATK